MAWETRGDQQYFYHKRRVNGRVVSEYYGAGWFGQAVKAHYLGLRACDGYDLDRRNRQRKEQADLDRQLADLGHQVRDFVAGVLLASGYRQHHRGEWRRRRDMSDKTTIQVAPKPAPYEISILAKSVLTSVMVSGGVSETTQPKLRDDLETMRQALGWADGSALERLLIENICVQWLRLQFCDQHLSHNSGQKNYTNERVDHFEARLSMSHRRYLEAVTALARVRKLGINLLQINIANQQAIMGPGASLPGG